MVLIEVSPRPRIQRSKIPKTDVLHVAFRLAEGAEWAEGAAAGTGQN
jgi:hypothetical protein